MKAASKFTLFVLGFVAFVTSFGAHVVAVNLAVYAKQVGVGLAMIGALVAVYGDMLGPLLIGILSQAFGLKVGFITCGVLGLGAIGLLRRTREANTPLPSNDCRSPLLESQC